MSEGYWPQILKVLYTVNGEVAWMELSVTDELLDDSEARKKMIAAVARSAAAHKSEERWGPGELTGEFPEFRWNGRPK